MKTKEELNSIKSEVDGLVTKLSELTDDELKLVVGGAKTDIDVRKDLYENIILSILTHIPPHEHNVM